MCRRYAGPFVLVRPAQNASIRSCCSFEVFPGESFALLGVGVTVALQLGKLSESPPRLPLGQIKAHHWHPGAKAGLM